MSVIEQYKDVFDRVTSINNEIEKLEIQKETVRSTFSQGVEARIQKLEESLKKIDDYMLKVQAYKAEAEKHIDSKNVLTVEAPQGYKVNLNRLRNWAMMIDPTSDNDPYAQRVYSVACCDELFLKLKTKEFSERATLLKSQQNDDADEEVKRIEQRIIKLRADLKEYALGKAVADLTDAVLSENRHYNYTHAPDQYLNRKTIPDLIYPGAYLAKLDFGKEQRIQLHNKLGDCYDAEKGYLTIPVGISNSREYILNVLCSPKESVRNRLYKGLRNLVMNSIDNNPAGTRKVFFFDAARFMPSTLGSLRKLESTFVLEKIPTNTSQLTEALERIISGFADTDEILNGADSIAAYNSAVDDPSKRLPFLTIILMGWSSSFEGRNLELIQRIMNSYERYGVSVITVTYKNFDDEKDDAKMPEFAAQSAIKIRMFNDKKTSIQFPDGTEQRFRWYQFDDELPEKYVESLKSCMAAHESKGNEYISWHSIDKMPEYNRSYKKVVLPFGIDGKEDEHYLSFENENFATFLMGASRSGKSTLLHTLIAGMIYGYHPDNLEIWMADFKQLEFKQYINHLPPHVKYVLLDESDELIFDLIDKLTVEMMERQKLFAKEQQDKIYNIDVTKLDKPLPVIFVILDEFSIMSQAIEDTPYQLKLQNLLAKGAALGIKFLFASQTFTSGVRGLTKTARAQIQQRIAMKASKEEIVETLELSTALKTEQVKNWMDALPPHYALVKFRDGDADTLPQVKRYLVMYFKDYDVRNDMIEMIKNSMTKTDKYNPNEISTYVDKHPVLVDGNSYSLFPAIAIKKLCKEIKDKESIAVSFGVPRLMERIKLSTITSETRENILLVGKQNEAVCIASIVLSVIKSLYLQNKKVEIWTYERDPIFNTYKDVLIKKNVSVRSGINEICDGIRLVKDSIKNKNNDDIMIILLGMERICMDFSYIENDEPASPSKPKKAAFNSTVSADSIDDLVETKLKLAWHDRMEEIKKSHPKLSKEKLEKLFDEEEKSFIPQKREELRNKYSNNPTQIVSQAVTVEAEPQTQSEGAYDATEDFAYIVKQGSRFGIHFFMKLGAVDDLKLCSLKPDFFRYKMSFLMSKEDSMKLFNEIKLSRTVSSLSDHVCQFNDSISSYSFRPYIHEGIGWDGWFVDDKGRLISPYENNEKEK